jgi:hypothetical protein
MSGDFRAVEKFVKEILIDLMAKKVMSIRAQASSTRGVQASPLTERRSEPSRTVPEKRTKHRDDLANAKLIPSIMPDCIMPLASVVSHESLLPIVIIRAHIELTITAQCLLRPHHLFCYLDYLFTDLRYHKSSVYVG